MGFGNGGGGAGSRWEKRRREIKARRYYERRLAGGDCGALPAAVVGGEAGEKAGLHFIFFQKEDGCRLSGLLLLLLSLMMIAGGNALRANLD